MVDLKHLQLGRKPENCTHLSRTKSSTSSTYCLKVKTRVETRTICLKMPCHEMYLKKPERRKLNRYNWTTKSVCYQLNNCTITLEFLQVIKGYNCLKCLFNFFVIHSVITFQLKNYMLPLQFLWGFINLSHKCSINIRDLPGKKTSTSPNGQGSSEHCLIYPIDFFSYFRKVKKCYTRS